MKRKAFHLRSRTLLGLWRLGERGRLDMVAYLPKLLIRAARRGVKFGGYRRR